VLAVEAERLDDRPPRASSRRLVDHVDGESASASLSARSLIVWASVARGCANAAAAPTTNVTTTMKETMRSVVISSPPGKPLDRGLRRRCRGTLTGEQGACRARDHALRNPDAQLPAPAPAPRCRSCGQPMGDCLFGEQPRRAGPESTARMR
jgi:hypothetical protein